MTFVREIPIDEIRVGDYFDAEIETHGGIYGKRPIWRRCQAIEIVSSSILKVKTSTRKNVVVITRDKIKSKFAWGER